MIVLVCSQFPFKGSESFLESEILFLGKTTEEVIVYPINAKLNNLVSLPKNVTYKMISKCDKWVLIFDILKSLFSSNYWKEFVYLIQSGITIKKILAMTVYQGQSLYFSNEIKKDLRNYNINGEVVFYSYWMHVHASIAARLKKTYKNSKWITRAHGYDLYEFRSSSGYLPERKNIFENVDLIASVSNKGRNYLIDKYPFINKNKVITSYLGTYNVGKNPFDQSKIRLLTVANMVEVKRIDRLIFALKYINDIEIEWIHYGEGILKENLKQLASENLPSNIHYQFMGQVDNKELLSEYGKKSFDCLISTSSSEGLPVSFMEAMSFGIPVIATDVGGCEEIVIDDYNGKLVPADIGARTLAEVIKSFVNLNFEEKMRIRKNARLTWEEKFNADKNYSNFFRLIKQL